MIKLMVVLFFITLLIVVAHSVMLDSKIEHIDELVYRGMDPEEAFKKVYK